MKNNAFIPLILALILTYPAFGQNGAADKAKQQARAGLGQVNPNPLLRPDLVMGKIWIVKAGIPTAARAPQPVTVLKKGESYVLYCQFTNGGRDLKGNWKLGYYIDGIMIWNQYWGDVPAGATLTKQYSGFVPTMIGNHTFKCRLDFDREIAEKDETNNRTHIPFKVIQ